MADHEATSGVGLSAEQKLQINDHVRSVLRGWLAFLGATNLVVLIGGLLYIFFVLPETALTRAQGLFQTRFDALEVDIGKIAIATLGAEQELGELEQREAHLSTTLEDLEGSIQTVANASEDDLHSAAAILRTVQQNLEASDILARLERGGGLLAPRLNETDSRSVTTSSTAFTTYWEPFEIVTTGGPLLVLFDVSYASNQEGGKRQWVRLLIDGSPVRTIMTHNQQPWELSSVVLNHLVDPLPPGEHTIEFEWRTNGGIAHFPHLNQSLGDTPSRTIMAFEFI